MFLTKLKRSMATIFPAAVLTAAMLVGGYLDYEMVNEFNSTTEVTKK